MSTSRTYLQFILEQLSDLEEITYRQMMGEYILYFHGKIAAYLCDGRLLVKPTPSAIRLTPNGKLEPPYAGAKDMLLIEDIDNRAFLTALFEAMYPELPAPKPKKKKKTGEV